MAAPMAIRDLELLLDKYSHSFRESDNDGNEYYYDFNDTDTLYNIINELVKCYNSEISELLKFPNPDDEKQVREYVKSDISLVLPAVERKIREIKKKSDEKVFLQWANLYDDALALASKRSLKHFALYLDLEKSDADKTWTETMSIFGGFWYFANDMVLNVGTNFIEKQLPTGYGKSYSDAVLIAWIFGVTPFTDVLKVFGNDANCAPCMNSVMSIMENPRYAKVFDFYKQFNCNPALIFDQYSVGEGIFKIHGSKMPMSFRVASKGSRLNGVRANYIFLDDITQQEDRANIDAHKSDIDKYKNIWSRRIYNSDSARVIASGTTYSVYDILSYLKVKFGYEKSVPYNKIPYTHISVNDVFKQNMRSAFICVPKLDYRTDTSTYPTKYPTLAARQERIDNYEQFMAMDQQTPVPPKGNPFHFDNLKCYEGIPKAGVGGRPEFHMAFLDTKRFGADYCAMPIFSKFNDKYYLVDGIFDDRVMKDLYDKIVSYIINFKIIKLYVEDNICEGIDQILNSKLHERKYNSCEIFLTFSYLNKDDMIAQSEGDIKANIMFPKYGIYPPSSEFGRGLDNVYTYVYPRYGGKTKHDDFIDAIAQFTQNEIIKSNGISGTISSFAR